MEKVDRVTLVISLLTGVVEILTGLAVVFHWPH